MGGVGKSALAAYLYHSLDFEAKFWADVSLKPDFTVFAEQAIRALGGRVFYPIDVTQLINNLLHLLSQHRCLLVVDNLETLLDNNRNWQDENYEQFFNCWQQQGINSTLLITTQDKPKCFPGLQQWYSLGGMKLEEGMSLLNKLAIKGTSKELKTFVKYVDGHPLTIKLVAGYLNEYCDGELNQVTELGLEQFDLAYVEAEGLHRNKQDARLSWIIQQHLNKLNLEQLEFLINLSVYRLPFNRKAANYIWGKSEINGSVIPKKLQEFCNRSLLIKTRDNKFQFESLVQRYIQKQVSNFTNAHNKAIEYYIASFKSEENWQNLEDIKEYLETIHHYNELKEYALANEVLCQCQDFLMLKGHYAILVEALQDIVVEWKNIDNNNDSNFAYALNLLGCSHIRLGNYSQAIEYCQESFNIFQEINSIYGMIRSLGNIAGIFVSLDKYQQAKNCVLQSLEIQQNIDENPDRAKSLNTLGIICRKLGEFDAAINYFNQSLVILQNFQERYFESIALNNIGDTNLVINNIDDAIENYQRAYNIQQEIGDRDGIARSKSSLGNAYLKIGDFRRAIELFQESLFIKQQIGSKPGEAVALGSLGDAHYFSGEYERAIDCYEQCLSIQQNMGEISNVSQTLGKLGNTLGLLKQYEDAIARFEQSLSISQQIGDDKCAGTTLNNLGDIFYKLGRYDSAIKYYYDSLDAKQTARQKIGNTHILDEPIASTWFNIGDTQTQLQRSFEAISAYRNAKRIYQILELEENIKDCDRAIQELEDIE